MKDKSPLVVPLCLLAAVGLLAGCKHKVIFATETSIGLNVSGVEMPNKVSFSYNRYEAAIVPRKQGAAADEGHSVYGGLDSDVKFDLPPRYRIKQVFATGEAARLAAGGETNSSTTSAATHAPPAGAHANDKPPAKSASDDRDHALYFGTASTFGLHLSIGEEHTPPSALLGYRRTEATYIPVPDPSREVRSVYADIEIASHATNRSGHAKAAKAAPLQSELGGVRIRQSFATGQAADIVAGSQSAKENLREAAGLSLGAEKIVQDKRAKLALILKKSTRDGQTVDGDSLERLLVENGQRVPGTADWKIKFHGKPLTDLENELQLEADQHLDSLAARAAKL